MNAGEFTAVDRQAGAHPLSLQTKGYYRTRSEALHSRLFAFKRTKNETQEHVCIRRLEGLL
ncbi:hypothetical protein [Candidatus Protochlamydia phocaeensis]|uniref:hypothetical protein n=1 Tax=Candidatus Protochlamydia phocaeensis TaxID=1414722 RepID=UPI0008392436|nr:hypothetical protein [Candidatus Protochlamydia phocaeensis]